MTTIILLVSPLPSFVFCHKKSIEKNQMVSAVSYKYLLANFVCSAVWLAYSFKVDNIDLIIINLLATIITCIFLSLYIYAKMKVGHHQRSFLMLLVSIPIIIVSYTEYVSTE